MFSMRRVASKRRFCLILLKPTHYCDDGYPIQWARSAVPSNSLACVYGIAKQCAEENLLGEDVDIEIHAIDECNTTIIPRHYIRRIKAAGAGMVMMVGVQSNQMPRALDIARPLREAGIQVGIGGFHVSGVIAMINGDDEALRSARAMGISIYAGEAEGRLDEVLKDAYAGALKPLYNYMNDLPGLDGAPLPLLGIDVVRRTGGTATSFDAGRGCPFQCSFCTIINVQGRKSRRRSVDDIEKIVRANLAAGIRRFFITDDNFARNKDWEIILDRLIELRERDRLHFTILIQVDTACHRMPNFIEKCRRAGVQKVYIGLENINPANLMAAKKKQNKITEYRAMLLAWQSIGVVTYAGFITGFPNDTRETIIRDVEIIKKELPVDVLEFFYLTPLPGSEDHQKLYRAGVPLDPDLNRYDLYHITAPHSRMSPAEWESAYAEIWKRYYSYEHCETVLKRAGARRNSFGSSLFVLAWFKGCIEIEGIHPVEGGILRRKVRRNRRPTMRREPVWTFYPKYLAETVTKFVRWAWMYARLRKIYLSIKHDPKRREYVDLALTPITDDEVATHAMLQTEEANSYLEQQRKIDLAVKSGAYASPQAKKREPVVVPG
jgi:radical SAM superfamily enzyme YgiQ (UPF0313 family)